MDYIIDIIQTFSLKRLSKLCLTWPDNLPKCCDGPWNVLYRAKYRNAKERNLYYLNVTWNWSCPITWNLFLAVKKRKEKSIHLTRMYMVKPKLKPPYLLMKWLPLTSALLIVACVSGQVDSHEQAFRPMSVRLSCISEMARTIDRVWSCFSTR